MNKVFCYGLLTKAIAEKTKVNKKNKKNTIRIGIFCNFVPSLERRNNSKVSKIQIIKKMKRKLLLLIVSVLFFGSMYAQQDHFVPDEVTGMTSFGIWGQVFIDGEAQTSNNIEVGLFIDDVCKTTARITSNAAGTRYRVILYATYGIDGDDQVNLPITFKLYNHDTEEEMDNCAISYTTTGNDLVLGSGSNLTRSKLQPILKDMVRLQVLVVMHMAQKLL